VLHCKNHSPHPFSILEILNILWRIGPSTVREVHEALSGKRTGYTTVLKQMQVMAEKGLLVRNERYRSHVYDARFAKEKTQQQLAGNLLHRAFGGCEEPYFRRDPADAGRVRERIEVTSLILPYEQPLIHAVGWSSNCSRCETKGTAATRRPPKDAPHRLARIPT
jgi:hypothetical protein